MSSNPDQKRSKERRFLHPAGEAVRADLKAYLDGELSPLRRWMVRIHVARCTACREEITWLQRLGKNMRSLEAARPRPELRSRILATHPPMDSVPMHSAPTQRRSARPTLRLAVSSGLACLLVVGAFAMSQYASHPPTHGSNLTNVKPSPDIQTAHTNPPPPNPEPKQSLTASHEKPSANTNDPFAPPPDIEKPDPTSKEASRQTALEMKRLQEDQVRKLPLKWNQTVAAVKNMKNREGVYIPVEIDVADMSAAQTKLEDWAHKTNSPVTVTPNANGSVAVYLRIAPEGGSAFFTTMKQAGTVLLLTSQGNGWVNPGKTVPASALVPDANQYAPVPAPPATAEPITTSHPQANGSKTEPPAKMEVAAKTDKRITIAVILVPTHPLPN